MPECEVKLIDVEPRTFAAVRGTARLSELSRVIRERLDEVWRTLAQQNLTATGHNLILYDSIQPGQEPSFDTYMGVEVFARFSPTGSVIEAQTPGGRVATAVHMGSYDGLAAASTCVRDWCQQHHVALAGPMWEVYGDWSEDPSQLRTDIFFLLRGDQ